ncbi:hypothetical protein ABE28_008945 [Peribacillus muralis]|uniref:Uncharacterized protein n=1 Tax=Peribacillus muralis TaxID=264697 RepID=A0A1B3XMN1_9BACI|nr:hypothetical protein [Peribacillus muralis]AOH54478.1 hypothetical protein ABE28_008945 [Peribacillus muralis]
MKLTRTMGQLSEVLEGPPEELDEYLKLEDKRNEFPKEVSKDEVALGLRKEIDKVFKHLDDSFNKQTFS